MTFTAWWRRWVWRWQTGVVVSVALMGVSSLINAVGHLADEANEHRNDRLDRVQISTLSQVLTCRSVAAAAASNIEGEIGRATALGLVAVARSDDELLIEQANRIEDLAIELGPALERRAQAIEECETETGRSDGSSPHP